jgi:hypothetical protein
MTSVFAKELRGCNLRLNAIAPGADGDRLCLKGMTPELVDRLAKRAPLARLGQPEDVAHVVAFLAGPDAGWVNGQVCCARTAASAEPQRTSPALELRSRKPSKEDVIVITGAGLGLLAMCGCAPTGMAWTRARSSRTRPLDLRSESA